MLRKTLALLLRALRVDARSIRPHLMRFALLVLVLYVLIFSSSMSSQLSAPGLTLFEAMAATNIWFIALIGVPYFSSAITEEKEERTLGLLKMADISGLSLMLGKWLPRVIGMLSLLAVQFPFTMLAITLGGLTVSQVLAAYLALLVYLLYVGAVSLLASVVCRTTATACRLAFFILIARAFVPYLMQFVDAGARGVGASAGPLGEWGASLSAASVTAHVSRALQVSFQETIWPFTLTWMMIETAALLATAWLVFEPCTRVEASEARAATWRPLATKRTGIQRRAWQAALIGKDYRLLGGGGTWTTVRFFLYLCAVISIAALAEVNGGRINPETFGYMAISFGLAMLVLELVIAAARVFRTEINDQTWSSLVVLPKSLPELAWSKIAGNVLGCWPALAIFGLGCLLTPMAIPQFLETMFSEVAAFLAFTYVMLQILLVLEITMLCSITLGWAGWQLAAPMAAFIVGFANVIIFTSLAAALFSMGGDMGVFLFSVMDLSAVVLVAGLAVTVGHRLTAKAADGT